MNINENIKRCEWVGTDELYIKYHDEEWGIPVYDSKKLFENICLEGQQSGLSWITILQKREEYRKAFFNFDPYKIQNMTDENIDKLMENKNLIRHRKKLESIVKNARAFVKMEENGENFSDFIWSFVDNKIIVNDIHTTKNLQSRNDISKKISKELKKRGFSFVGEVTMYAFMQAMGLVNDHFNYCYCKNREVSK